jgi:hypothetical protein
MRAGVLRVLVAVLSLRSVGPSRNDLCAQLGIGRESTL